jgi:hypothetical protein
MDAYRDAMDRVHRVTESEMQVLQAQYHAFDDQGLSQQRMDRELSIGHVHTSDKSR